MVQIGSSSPPAVDGPRTLARKREILRGASRAFRRRGLHATGMREIAAELGMHVGNLYYYFRNKEELLAFCQQETLSSLRELALGLHSRTLPPEEKLRRLIIGHIVRLNEQIPGSLAHLEVEAVGPRLRESILAQRDEYERVLREILTAGIETSAFRELDVKVACMAILGALNWTVKWYRPEGGRSSTEIGEQFARLLLEGLRFREPSSRPDAGSRTGVEA